MLCNIKAIYRADPAAKHLEVILYPGLWAIGFHRITHFLHKLCIPFIPRLISQISRFFTMIEIHPGAKLGKGLFIDHGSGVVIGATAVVGDWCLIYHSVTLGGTGYSKGKRHPTLGNHVVVGPGAKILGNVKIGDNCRIGANSVVITDVPADSTVVGNPGVIIPNAGLRIEDELEHGKLPDPVLETINQLRQRIEALEKK